MPCAPGRVGGRARVGPPARKKDMHVRNAAHPGKEGLAARHVQHAQAALPPLTKLTKPLNLCCGKVGGRLAICILCRQAGRRVAAQLLQHAQAALVPVVSGKVGGRVTIYICCRQAGCRVAAQLVQHAQAARVTKTNSSSGEALSHRFVLLGE